MPYISKYKYYVCRLDIEGMYGFLAGFEMTYDESNFIGPHRKILARNLTDGEAHKLCQVLTLLTGNMGGD